MCQSQYEGIVEVQSFSRIAGHRGAEDSINDLLKKEEWVLLEVVASPATEGSSASVVYVLGRKEEKEG